MSRFLKDILTFIPLACIVYILLVILIGEFSPFHSNLNYKQGSYGHMQTRIQEVEDVSDIDILFLGSSHAYRGFDVRMYDSLGLKVFNLGSSSQSPVQTKMLLDRYLKTLNPKHIIFEINPGRLASDGVESSIDIIANSKNDFNSLKMALTVGHIKTINTLIFGFYKDITSAKRNKEALVRGVDTYIPGGFVEKQMKYYTKDEYFPPKVYEWKDCQLDALDNIIVMADESNIKLTFVHSPVTQVYMAAYSNKAEFDDFMESKGTYYDFNKIVDMNDSLDFYDPKHLNQNGVEKFNKAVIETLQFTNRQY